ncbi:Protein of unknown function (DUF3567) [Burkholderiales bacterium JOSHI_001]|nr:Protein of unknown function (DUF3567) [Burkholderiales bacterium JOSHI_001]
MQMLYNSDSFAVVEVDLGALTAAPGSVAPPRGGYEIVDKFARKEIFIDGLLAERFKQGVQALVSQGDASEENFDDFISGFTLLGQQPLVMH